MMESIPFTQIENAISDLIAQIDQLSSENSSLKREIDNLKGNNRDDTGVVDALRKEKEELVKKIAQSQPDQKKEEQIRNRIDSILKKLDKLHAALQ